MMTVMIECGEEAAALGASLASLVPGAIEGLVRDVVVLDRAMDAATRKVADHAGCRLAPVAALREAIVGTKGEWLMLIEPGARLGPEWVEGVGAHLSDVMAGMTPRPARFSTSRRDRPSVFKRLPWRRSALADGLILPKAQAIGLAARARSLEEVGKGIAAIRLDTAIRPRPR